MVYRFIWKWTTQGLRSIAQFTILEYADLRDWQTMKFLASDITKKT